MAQFVVFGESPGPGQPSEGALDDPALGQYLECVQFIAFDHLHLVSKPLFGPADQLARVAAIDEDRGDAVEPTEQPHQHRPGGHPVLNTSRMHHHRQQIAFRVYRDVALAPLDFLACVVTALPPFSAVFTDCESTIATLGAAFRPFALRETADAPTATVGSRLATAAIGNLSSPRKAGHPPPAAVHTCADGPRRDAGPAAPSATASAWPTACPSNHLGT